MKVHANAEINLADILTNLNEDDLSLLVVDVYNRRQKPMDVGALICHLATLLIPEPAPMRKEIAERVRHLLKLPCPTCGGRTNGN